MGDPWEKEEVLALLRIRSSMGHGFSDFIWGHVSRKLAELGYKRSPEKCKEKYEEMNQYCNDTTTTTNYSTSKNYNRSFSELEALFEDHHQNPKATTANTSVVDNEDEKHNMVRSGNDNGGDEDDSQGKMGLNLEENSGNETLENPFVENVVKKQSRSKKRKRHDHKLELLKGLCEEIVNKIMNQQEELHKKLLQDMERKEEERVRREEIWKNKEMDRVNKEIEMRAKEQAIACDRETTIIEFLKKFTSSISSSSQNDQEDLSVKIENIIKTSLQNPTASSSSPSIILPSSSENPKSALSSVLVVPTTQNTPKVPTSSSHVATATNTTPSPTHSNQKIPNLSHLDLVCENPNSIITTQNNNQADVTSSSTTTTTTTAVTVSHEPGSTSNNDREENGKRWPRDEVYSLINLRCNLGNSSSNGGEDKENTKIPLWEKISQGMSELGYKRSAKKCKEKWENINKYFRKTKDTNKKRSVDSKTCPYFHQLNTLYNQGRLTLPSDGPENQSENPPESPERAVANGKEEGAGDDEKNNNASQVSAPLEFEY
ncbi:hypothetical protein MKW94_002522 [Papaver nudicaule]|uniref:Myb-like domain-containing protein n=1 Tax=Papaver nudicaule TaxID=74823 RepID=A0AA41UY08_PAPNU|nr:hypothetical protein [Papaver nudicaule]